MSFGHRVTMLREVGMAQSDANPRAPACGRTPLPLLCLSPIQLYQAHDVRKGCFKDRPALPAASLQHARLIFFSRCVYDSCPWQAAITTTVAMISATPVTLESAE